MLYIYKVYTEYLQNDRRRVLRTILICRQGTSVTSTKSRMYCVHTAGATLPVDPKLAYPD